MEAVARNLPAPQRPAPPSAAHPTKTGERDVEDERAPVQKLWGSTLVPNVGSTARDYGARERNFLSMVKMTVTLALVGAALLIRFQFGEEIDMPVFEKHAQTPLGILFFIACLATLAVGTFSFYSVSAGYEHRQAFVYSGRINDVLLVSLTALVFTTCVVLLVGNA